MKTINKLFLSTGGIIAALFLFTQIFQDDFSSDYDVYQYAKECKDELEITVDLPQLSCLDGKQIPIYVDNQEINSDNWEELLSSDKQCDNPHWLGGDMGCWTYSHIQTVQLDDDNVLVLNCRQKGNQLDKNWFRKTKSNLGLDQQQRKQLFDNAPANEKKELYFLYNTFNDIGLILRNTKSGKSCYFTQYGDAVVGFLPPLDKPLPKKEDFLNAVNSKQSKPPANFPEHLWYRDANQAFRSPSFTADAGCIDCHNAHGFKYSPYINSKQGIPSIYSMAPLPMLPVGDPFKKRFRDKHYRQVTTEAIDGKKQLCTQCHNMTTTGTCGASIDYATGKPNTLLHNWLTVGSNNRWMPPMKVDNAVLKKHVAAIKCCCSNPDSKGCLTRKFGPTRADLPGGFSQGQGWVKGQEYNLCQEILSSFQWDADKM